MAIGAAFIAPPAHPNKPASQCGPVTAKSSQPFISKIWDKARWKRGSPGSTALRAWREKLRCAGPKNRAAMKLAWMRERLSYGRYRAFRRVAPYPGGGTYWAIPYYIVYCESRGKWMAYNPSGAVGAYQLLGWGAPYPAQNWHEKMQNHQIAADVYADGAGASNWVCA